MTRHIATLLAVWGALLATSIAIYTPPATAYSATMPPVVVMRPQEEEVVCRTVSECSHAIQALRRETRLEFDQRAIALEQARRSIDDRLLGMNEFRASLRDQSNTFATKGEMVDTDRRLAAIEKREAMVIGGSIALQFLFAVGFALYLRSQPKSRPAETVSRYTDRHNPNQGE